MIKTVAGIDFGANKIKVTLLSLDAQTNEIKTKSIIKIKSYGLIRQNSIIDFEQTITALEKAIRSAKEKSQSEIDDFAIACDGQNIIFKQIETEISIPGSASEITEHDIQILKRRAEQKIKSADPRLKNYALLSSHRTNTFVNGEPILSNNPEGLSGNKLKGVYSFIFAHKQFINDVASVFESLDYKIDLDNFFPGIPTIKEYMLAKEYTIPGCALVDIGSDTTKVAVFENDDLIFYHNLNIGSDIVTNEIVKKFGVSLTDAEQLKLGVLSRSEISEKKLQAAISSAYKNLFKSILADLKEQEWFDFLPGGLILTGGGSLHPQASSSAKSVFGNMPVKNLYEHTQKSEFKKVAQEAIAPSYVSALHFLSFEHDTRAGFGLFSKLTKKIKSLLP